VEVTVSARHTEVPEKLRRVTEEKMQRLARYVDGMDRAEVHFTEERNPRVVEREICEVTLEGHGHHVRCKVAAADAFVALDRAVEKLEHQLQRLKTKLQRRYRGDTGGRSVSRTAAGAVVPAVVPEADADADAEFELEPHVAGLDGSDGSGAHIPRIVKKKRFAPMPMTPEEAAQRMELIGHGFFFFTNIDTSRAAVVYWREDGDIGLIDEAG
jgi:ribosomal subunit interface protein